MIVSMPTSSLVLAGANRDTVSGDPSANAATGDSVARPDGDAAPSGRIELLDNLRAAMAEISSLPDSREQVDAARERALLRLQAVDHGHRTFCRAAAHDLRNPLSAIRGQSQLLARRIRRDAAAGAVPDIDRLTTGLAAIDDAVGRLNLMIGALLDQSPEVDDGYGAEANGAPAGPDRLKARKDRD